MCESLNLKQLTEMLYMANNRSGCLRGIRGHCGCGVIHEMMYMCNYHRSELLSDSNLAFD